MELRFILGRAGAGKTYTCLAEIRRRLDESIVGSPLILLVPEQATFQMERVLAATHPLVRAHVFSFQRLAWRVLQDVGGAARKPIGDLGKRMVLSALLNRHQAELKLFHRSVRHPGFIEKVKSTLGELCTYRQTPHAVRQALRRLEDSGEGDTVLAGKLHDLALLYDEYAAWLGGRLIDPDDWLNLAVERLPHSRLAQKALVWVDGFAGFTPQEYAVVTALMQTAQQVNLTLCLDPIRAEVPHGHLDLFQPTYETYVKLAKLAEKHDVRVEVTRLESLPESRFRQAPLLAHLEREFPERPGEPYRNGGDGVQDDGAQEDWSIRLVEASNPRLEVEAAAREILRLVRDEGFLFREIALIVREFGPYSDLLTSIFHDYGIPYFVDQKRPVAHHPAVELLRSAIEVVTSRWAFAPVFRSLKTDLIDINRDAVDSLENYVLEHGIHGSRWYDSAPWTYRRRYSLDDIDDADDEGAKDPLDPHHEYLNRCRRRVTTLFRKIDTDLQEGRRPLSVREICRALYRFLDRVGVADTLDRWAADATRVGRLEKAQEHIQVWNGIVGLFDEMVAGLGDAEMSLTDFLQVLETGLEGLRLGVIPPSLDQLMIGSIERSRQPDLRAVLLLGANERVFPCVPAQDVILDDRDREKLTGSGFELGPTSRTRLLREQFLCYIALTRASERLWISYSTAADNGKGLAPSGLIRRVRELFPHLSVETIGTDAGGDVERDLATVVDREQLVGTLARRLRELAGTAGAGGGAEDAWMAVYEWAREKGLLERSPDDRRLGAHALAALEYNNHPEPLPPELVASLFLDPDGRLLSSVSRLESFARCPFQHFAAYGLGLKERRRYRVEKSDLGTLLHAALRVFVERLWKDGVDWAALDPGEAVARVNQVVDQLAPRLQSEILLSSARHQYLTECAKRTLGLSVLLWREHALRGSFRPAWVEASFGDGCGLPAWEIDLSAALPPALTPAPRLVLRGQIDRVDLAGEPGGTKFVRVIDYKAYHARWRLQHFYHGISLQLPTYLAVVLRSDFTLEPAGLFYFGVRDPIVSVEPLEGRVESLDPQTNLHPKRLKQMKLRGLLLGSTEVIRLMEEDGRGELIPASLNKDGSPSRASACLASHEQFRLLLDSLEARLAKLARAILEGRTDVRPYAHGQERACALCAFKPTCRLDPLVPGNGFRTLELLGREEVWERLAQEAAEEAQQPGGYGGAA